MTQARILVVEDDNGLREALVDTLLLGAMSAARWTVASGFCWPCRARALTW